MPELGKEETESSLVSTEQTRDPVRETEEELLGLDRLLLTAEDEQENNKYLASMAIFGNQMMLELMQNKLSMGQKPKRGDPEGFAVVTDYLETITAGYDETVNKDNFPTKYGNMLVKYSDLIKACALYAESRNGKKHLFSSERQIEITRLQQVDQIAQIAQREMLIIRQRSGKLAKSENDVTWKDLFLGEGQAELLHYAEKEKQMEKARLKVALKAKQKDGDLLTDIPKSEPSGETLTESPTEKILEKQLTVQELQVELTLLQEKCASIQKALDRLLTPKTEEPEHTEETDSNPDTAKQ